MMIPLLLIMEPHLLALLLLGHLQSFLIPFLFRANREHIPLFYFLSAVFICGVCLFTFQQYHAIFIRAFIA
ncbi:unnamed protein product [Linum trigynum]